MDHSRFRAARVCALALAAVCAPLTAAAQEEKPEAFKIGPQGDLTCVGVSEDSCGYYEEIQAPGRTLFLVQGTTTVKTHPSQLRQVGPHLILYSFAFLCEREGDMLKPVFDLLEGRERSSDVYLRDLDGDGISEIAVVGVFDSRGSYASVYRIDPGGQAVRMFTRRANTPNTIFEERDGIPSITLEQRNPKTHGDLVREVFVWNGKEFALQP